MQNAPLRFCMTVTHECSILGWCPCCGSRLSREQLLARYDPPEGWPRMLAECGRCEEVVLPV